MQDKKSLHVQKEETAFVVSFFLDLLIFNISNTILVLSEFMKLPASRKC